MRFAILCATAPYGWLVTASGDIRHMSRNKVPLSVPCSVCLAHPTTEKPRWRGEAKRVTFTCTVLCRLRWKSMVEHMRTGPYRSSHESCACQEKQDSLANEKENKKILKYLKMRYVNFRCDELMKLNLLNTLRT